MAEYFCHAAPFWKFYTKADMFCHRTFIEALENVPKIHWSDKKQFEYINLALGNHEQYFYHHLVVRLINNDTFIRHLGTRQHLQ